MNGENHGNPDVYFGGREIILFSKKIKSSCRDFVLFIIFLFSFSRNRKDPSLIRSRIVLYRWVRDGNILRLFNVVKYPGYFRAFSKNFRLIVGLLVNFYFRPPWQGQVLGKGEFTCDDSYLTAAVSTSFYVDRFKTGH